ncbi:hypothetical protein E3J74_01450 [Candidatus Bathyarchaeota archaeon]|nr:MAG: hypothetical protein E3J74_01450 [Candidatus Bathyarchaeota archaeon]
MFPRVVIEDLEDLCNTVSTLKGLLPTETEIITEEFRREVNAMREEEIERIVPDERYQKFRVGDRLCRKYLIHQTEKETKLTGADLAIEIEGQKLFFVQAKREGANHKFHFDRRQMMQLMWLNDEIIEKTFFHPPIFPYFPHSLSYRVPCFYKMIFLKFPSTKSFRRQDIQIEEERYLPVKQVDLILGRRKSGSSEEFRTGYTPSEFQAAIEKCEAGSPDLENEDLKQKIFLEYSKLADRLVVHLSIR